MSEEKGKRELSRFLFCFQSLLRFISFLVVIVVDEGRKTSRSRNSVENLFLGLLDTAEKSHDIPKYGKEMEDATS